MKKINLQKPILIIVFFLTLISCNKDEQFLEKNNNSSLFLTDEDKEGMIEIGKKLKNPYSIENMKKALKNLKSLNKNLKNIDIKPTHLYVRFKPKNELELDLLKKDSTLVLYDYPLDFEIKKTGDFYHDPTLPLSQPTYQYAAVSTEKKLNKKIESEILSKLFIPDENKNNSKSSMTSNEIDILVDEALRITDNLEEIKDKSFDVKRRRKWRPSGRIRVWDDVADRFVPVVGIEVRARRWFTTHKGTTNSQGFYNCDGRFRRRANYSLKWETYHFSIRSGTFGQAVHKGPKTRGSWSPNFGRNRGNIVNDIGQYYALIFQGARDYYYGNRFGLASPPRNSFFRPQTKIAANRSRRQLRKRSHAAIYARTGGVLPTIYIREWSRNADRVYAVTVHELAHYSHWNLNRKAFRSIVKNAYIPPFNWVSQLQTGKESYAAVLESWANGVEWRFAQERYRNTLRIPNYEYTENYQNYRIPGRNIYTSLVVDLIDNENQRNTRGHAGNTDFPLDRVSGYSIQQIERALTGAESWNSWRDRIIRIDPNNPTRNRVNELFGNWHR